MSSPLTGPSARVRAAILRGAALIGAAAWLCLSASAQGGLPDERREQSGPALSRPPNIVFVMVDDLGYADLGCYGGRAIPTPNLDAMAAAGLRFTQAYSGCTVCAPARSVLMTGRHMGHGSVRLNTGGVPLLDEDVTVAEELQRLGYATGGFGKWGLGDLETTGVPERQGFDRFFGYYHQIHAHWFLPDYAIDNGRRVPLPGNEGFYPRGKNGRQRHRTGPFSIEHEESGRRREFMGHRVVDEMFSWLRETVRTEPDRPVFCYAPWTPPHGEYVMPADDPAWRQFKDRKWPLKARVAAAYTAMIDRQMGELFALLRELEIEDETIVFFCSDHGAAERFVGSLDSCGPFRGRKRSMYEGGLRVPMIAKWPKRITPATVTEHVCSFQDVLPTLVELAGGQPSAVIDGISMLPTLVGAEAAGREQPVHASLYWEWAKYDWGKRALAEDGLLQAVRFDGHWKAVRHGTGAAIELYDLRADPGEQSDLANEHPNRVRRAVELLRSSRTPMRAQAEPKMPPGRSYR